MKIIKKINDFRHIIPDKYKVYIYGALGLISLFIGKIASTKGNIDLQINCLLYAIGCIFFEIYFVVKTSIKDIREYKRKDEEIKYMLIKAKIKAQIPLEHFEEKFLLKIKKREFKKLKRKAYKQLKQKLKEMRKIKI